MKQNFSVLMSIYIKENPDFFNRAMESIWDEQTIQPTEIVLVKDGPLTDELNEIISKWESKLERVLKVITLEYNVGLGEALNHGMKHCSNELIARMDSDDISLSHRFEKQLQVFQETDVDICSAIISEFEGDEENIISYRRLPEEHKEIVKFAKTRSPLNHIPVMFKKSKIDEVGGYKTMLWFEDYYLWARLIVNDVKFYNIQEPLANIRAGYSQLERRRGIPYALNEYKLQKEFLRIGFINNLEFVRNILVRFTFRLLPSKLLKIVYKFLRKQ